jgi:hypothetical protein
MTTSLRDRFAASAMHGLLSSNRDTQVAFIATRAYEIADAMLKAREAGLPEWPDVSTIRAAVVTTSENDQSVELGVARETPAAEPNDTVRPPAFTPDEVDSLSPVSRTLPDDELEPRRMVPRWPVKEETR